MEFWTIYKYIFPVLVVYSFRLPIKKSRFQNSWNLGSNLGFDDILSEDDVIVSRARFEYLRSIFSDLNESELEIIVKRSPVLIAVDKDKIKNAVEKIRKELPSLNTSYLIQHRSAGVELIMLMVSSDKIKFRISDRIKELDGLLNDFKTERYILRVPHILVPRYQYRLEDFIFYSNETLHISKRQALDIVLKWPDILSLDISTKVSNLNIQLRNMGIETDRKFIAKVLSLNPHILEINIVKILSNLYSNFPRLNIRNIVRVHPQILFLNITTIQDVYQDICKTFSDILSQEQIDTLIADTPVILEHPANDTRQKLNQILREMPRCSPKDFLARSPQLLFGGTGEGFGSVYISIDTLIARIQDIKSIFLSPPKPSQKKQSKSSPANKVSAKKKPLAKANSSSSSTSTTTAAAIASSRKSSTIPFSTAFTKKTLNPQAMVNMDGVERVLSDSYGMEVSRPEISYKDVGVESLKSSQGNLNKIRVEEPGAVVTELVLSEETVDMVRQFEAYLLRRDKNETTLPHQAAISVVDEIVAESRSYRDLSSEGLALGSDGMNGEDDDYQVAYAEFMKRKFNLSGDDMNSFSSTRNEGLEDNETVEVVANELSMNELYFPSQSTTYLSALLDGDNSVVDLMPWDEVDSMNQSTLVDVKRISSQSSSRMGVPRLEAVEGSDSLVDEEEGVEVKGKGPDRVKDKDKDLDVSLIVLSLAPKMVATYPMLSKKLLGWVEAYGPSLAYSILSTAPAVATKNPESYREILKLVYSWCASRSPSRSDGESSETTLTLHNPTMSLWDVDQATTEPVSLAQKRLRNMLRKGNKLLDLSVSQALSRLDELSELFQFDPQQVQGMILETPRLLTEKWLKIRFSYQMILGFLNSSSIDQPLNINSSSNYEQRVQQRVILDTDHILKECPRVLVAPVSVFIRLYFTLKMKQKEFELLSTAFPCQKQFVPSGNILNTSEVIKILTANTSEYLSFIREQFDDNNRNYDMQNTKVNFSRNEVMGLEGLMGASAVLYETFLTNHIKVLQKNIRTSKSVLYSSYSGLNISNENDIPDSSEESNGSISSEHLPTHYPEVGRYEERVNDFSTGRMDESHDNMSLLWDSIALKERSLCGVLNELIFGSIPSSSSSSTTTTTTTTTTSNTTNEKDLHSNSCYLDYVYDLVFSSINFE